MKYLPISVPSKPKTLTSSGTRRPRSDNARITPMATMSDMQKTAVASLPSLKKAFALAHAPSREKSVSTYRLSSKTSPALRKASSTPW